MRTIRFQIPGLWPKARRISVPIIWRCDPFQAACRCLDPTVLECLLIERWLLVLALPSLDGAFFSRPPTTRADRLMQGIGQNPNLPGYFGYPKESLQVRLS